MTSSNKIQVPELVALIKARIINLDTANKMLSASSNNTHLTSLSLGDDASKAAPLEKAKLFVINTLEHSIAAYVYELNDHEVPYWRRKELTKFINSCTEKKQELIIDLVNLGKTYNESVFQQAAQLKFIQTTISDCDNDTTNIANMQSFLEAKDKKSHYQIIELKLKSELFASRTAA